MADEEDIRISISLDPGVFTSIEGYEQHTSHVGCVVNAITDVHRTLAQLHEVRAAVQRDRTLTPEARVLEVGRIAEKQQPRLVGALDRAERDLTANITHTEKQLREPLAQDAGLGSLNGEVRTFARGLDRAGRSALIREAMEADDEATLTAILGAQPFLSGLTKEDHDYHLWRYHAKRNPTLVARLETMHRFRDMLGRIPAILPIEIEKAVGAKPGEVAALRNANDRAQRARSSLPRS